MEFACLTLFVITGMAIAAGIGWRIGQIISPRPEILRNAASHSSNDDVPSRGAWRSELFEPTPSSR